MLKTLTALLLPAGVSPNLVMTVNASLCGCFSAMGKLFPAALYRLYQHPCRASRLTPPTFSYDQ
jgi:hypothetical protein